MARCHGGSSNNNNIGSLLLDHQPTTTTRNHSRQYPAFSTTTLRRLILDALSCGGSSRQQNKKHASMSHTVATVRSTLNNKQEPKAAALNKTADRLADLLNMADLAEEIEMDADTKKKEEALEMFKSVAKELQEADVDVRKMAAGKVRKFAKEDAEARVMLAMLGTIPPLVGMLDLEDQEDGQISSLYALLNLAIGNDVNKAAIVKAGAIHKMLKLIESPDPPNLSVSEAIVANFLGLSALDSNKPIIGSSGAIPFLVKIYLDSKSSSQAKQDALRALYNLSIYQLNISFILETDFIPYLLNALGDMEVSERVLSILSNVVSTPEGRKAISKARDAFPILVDVLNWTDSPGCQEKASYILMVMAHKAYGDRQTMIDAGITSALLELTLLGSTLAQKRASRILECLRMDKGKQVSVSYGGNLGATVSAPIYGSSSSSTYSNGGSRECLENNDMMSEENKAIKQLVQQSLQNNMNRIVNRANLPEDFIPSEHFKSLTSSSTSKSLPF